MNPFKRGQYDRDRLEYLYTHFNTHESFATAANLPARFLTARDEQIQVYAVNLIDRVKDPIEEKKKAIIRRIATIRNEVAEFNELSLEQRQDWATSSNRVLRMAGNALCEVVVCAEEDLRMLEDELGRVDGVLEPKDKDGPAGRVTSGRYGSEISSMSMLKGKPSVLMNQRVPSVPRSPTVPIHPKSASKLGVQGQEISGLKNGDTPSSEGTEVITKVVGNDRVNDFLLGPTCPKPQPHNITDASKETSAAEKPQAHMSSFVGAIKKASDDRPYFGPGKFSANTAMGLVDYQRLHGLRNVDEDPDNDATATATTWAAHQNDLRNSSSAAVLSMSHHPIPASTSWRNSWDPAYVHGVGAPSGSFGFQATQPAARGSATASNTVLFKEVQDRAAAAARAPGRWVVAGPGLTTFKDASGQTKKRDSEDPFA